MMNVPIIFYAARETGDARTGPRLPRPIAAPRATRWCGPTARRRTKESSIWRRASSCDNRRIRGCAADSNWARGLAWSLYGYSQVYALTGEREFLDVAERNADFWLTHLPEDHVPYWDFAADLSAPLPWGPQKDSRPRRLPPAACWIWSDRPNRSTGPSPIGRRRWPCSTRWSSPSIWPIDTPGWEGILKHGVYHTAKNLGVDESVMWGEFFFVEAMMKVVSIRTHRASTRRRADRRIRRPWAILDSWKP